MKFKTIKLLIIALIVLCVSISAVSAADTSFNETQPNDFYAQDIQLNNYSEEIQLDENVLFSECATIILQISDLDTVASHRRDATNSATIEIEAKNFNGLDYLEQFKNEAGYFGHCIISSDGWFAGNGGVTDGSVFRNIEQITLEMMSAKEIDSDSYLKIYNILSRYSLGHFVLKSPDGNYVVVYPNTYFTGKLNPGEYLVVPNVYGYFKKGTFDLNKNYIDESIRIASLDPYGVNRRNIMTYEYKLTELEDGRFAYGVNCYASNDNGVNVGRRTSGLVDNVYFFGELTSRYNIPQNPGKLYLGTHIFKNRILGNFTIVTKDLIKYYQTPDPFIAYVLDEKNNPVSSVEIAFTINGKTYTRTTDENGKAQLNINLQPGNYTLTTTMRSKTITNNINVLNVNLITKDLVKYYQTPDPFIAYTVDNNNTPIKGVEIAFTINGKTYTRTTDENGKAQLNINLAAGHYTITTTMGSKTITNNINVLNMNLVTKDLVKYYQTPDPFIAYIVDDNNTAISGIKISFTINGRTYDRITDENGSAKLNINLQPGKYTLTTTMGSEVVYNTISVIYGDIITTDLVKYYKTSDPFVAYVVNHNGTKIPGVEIAFTINGKTYTRTTDENGKAQLNINLQPGNYTITTTMDGQTVENNITVLNVNLVTKDLVKYYQTPDPFIAYTVDDNNTPIKGVEIAFTINGKTYTRTTDENGKAQLNINLQPGNYTITTTMGSEVVYNTISVIYGDIITTDLVKYYQTPDPFVAYVVNHNGTKIPGVEIAFTINGKTYTRTTDENGKAQLNINLQPGNYTITTTMGQQVVYNTIIVKQSVLSDENFLEDSSNKILSTC